MKKMELTSLKQKNPEQSKVLEELESIIGKNIPIVDRIAAGVLGVIVENNNVVELGLSEQNLLSLPESIENLESLRILQLYKNQLTTLPESIGELKALTGLYLHSNNLTYLPESLGNLISLKELELSNNKLNALPNSFWKLKKLKTIDLTNNPLNVDYNSMNESNAQSILDFCRKLATIDIFISHAVEDYEYFQIKNISNFLEQQNEIHQVFYCEDDLKGNIDEWMSNTVSKCNLLLFFASKRSTNYSPDCQNELILADKYNIPAIPIKSEEILWSELGRLKIAREMGLDFKKDELNQFCMELYKYICELKREVDLLDRNERYIGISKIYERFRIEYKELEGRILKLEENFNNIKKKD